jgi:hypothetical protein
LLNPQSWATTFNDKSTWTIDQLRQLTHEIPWAMDSDRRFSKMVTLGNRDLARP